MRRQARTLAALAALTTTLAVGSVVAPAGAADGEEPGAPTGGPVGPWAPPSAATGSPPVDGSAVAGPTGTASAVPLAAPAVGRAAAAAERVDTFTLFPLGWHHRFVDAVVGRDAVYFRVAEPTACTEDYLMELPISADAGGVVLDAPRVVGRTFGGIAEHDGELAYLDPAGDLVVRAADGTVTRPAWGRDPSVLTFNGPWAMSRDWFAAGRWLVDRDTGRTFDLTLGVPGMPPGVAGPLAGSPVVTDDRVLFRVDDNKGLGIEGRFQAIYTVHLGPDGPVGTPVQLDVTRERFVNLEPAGITDDAVAWVREGEPDPGRPADEIAVDVTWVSRGDVAGPASRERVPGVTGTWRLAPMTDGDEVLLTVSTRPGGVGNDYALLAHPLGGDTRQVVSVPDAVGMLYSAAGGVAVHADETYVTWFVTDTRGRGLRLGSGWTEAPAPVTTPPPPASPEPEPLALSDVPVDHPFRPEINWMTARGLATGYPDGTFRGTAAVTREAMAAFLYRLAGSPRPTGPVPFSDVAPDAAFAPAIAWLAERGIADGYADGTFRPGATVSRQAAAAWLHRAVRAPAPIHVGNSAGFTDVPVTSPFAADVSWMQTTSMSRGFGDGTFHPLDPVSREATAAFLKRLGGGCSPLPM